MRILHIPNGFYWTQQWTTPAIKCCKRRPSTCNHCNLVWVSWCWFRVFQPHGLLNTQIGWYPSKHCLLFLNFIFSFFTLLLLFYYYYYTVFFFFEPFCFVSKILFLCFFLIFFFFFHFIIIITILFFFYSYYYLNHCFWFLLFYYCYYTVFFFSFLFEPLWVTVFLIPFPSHHISIPCASHTRHQKTNKIDLILAHFCDPMLNTQMKNSSTKCYTI